MKTGLVAKLILFDDNIEAYGVPAGEWKFFLLD